MLPKDSALTWRLLANPDKSGPDLSLGEMSPMLRKRHTFKSERGFLETLLFSTGSEHEFDPTTTNFRVSDSVGLVSRSGDGTVPRDV